MTFRLRHRESPDLWLDRRTRRESGRYRWRGWLKPQWTNDPTDAMTWQTRPGVEGYVDRYTVSLSDRVTIEEVEDQ